MFNKFLKLASSSDIIIEAPLLGFSKELVLKMLSENGIKMEDLYSGYGSWD
jgi:7-cyano-7-deazaguanine synthase in queuosine biosynthesis